MANLKLFLVGKKMKWFNDFTIIDAKVCCRQTGNVYVESIYYKKKN